MRISFADSAARRSLFRRIELLMRKREQWGVICGDSTLYIDLHSRRWSTTAICRYPSLFYHRSGLTTEPK